MAVSRWARIARRAFAGLLVLVMAAALYIWWADGMWWRGAMPTHGLIRTLAGSGFALVLLLIAEVIEARKG